MKILLTGASSFLGWNICEAAKGKLEIHGLVNRHSSNRDDITEHQVDLSEFGAVDQVIETTQPECIIHVAAYSKPDLCQKNPVISQKINIEVTLHLAHHANNRNIPFVFTSTDLVFDGLKGNYSESDDTNPISIYGKHKLLAEELIGEVHPGSLICRCPLMYGYSGSENKSYLSKMMQSMKNGDPVHLFTDEFRSQAHAMDVAGGILSLLEQRCNGLYHLGGPESISRFEFGTLVTDVFKLEEANLIPALQQSVQSIPPRPPDVSLDISKAKRKSYQPKSPADGLKAMMKLMAKHG